MFSRESLQSYTSYDHAPSALGLGSFRNMSARPNHGPHCSPAWLSRPRPRASRQAPAPQLAVARRSQIDDTQSGRRKRREVCGFVLSPALLEHGDVGVMPLWGVTLAVHDAQIPRRHVGTAKVRAQIRCCKPNTFRRVLHKNSARGAPTNLRGPPTPQVRGRALGNKTFSHRYADASRVSDRCAT